MILHLKYKSVFIEVVLKLLSLYRSSSSKPATSAVASEEQTADEYYMDIILNRHARKLFASNRIRDLGMFAAHVDFKLVDWLMKER